ncbi:hypothetical protein CRG98_042474 [Punica granatum]|uniref:MATH domain-containing protein n=1 Tax=Punica granatum TaxID=22663 RepID=A0A2I0HZK1_PUNGR|nr:hypothetical protein CRG98_042474 [Punica granatum]
MAGAQLPSGKYTCRISSFFKVKNERIWSSEEFTVGCCKWGRQIRIYPKGDDTARSHLHIYLVVAGAAALPEEWWRDAKFVLTVDQHSGVGSTANGLCPLFPCAVSFSNL